MAQLFFAALRLAGHKPFVASRFRSFDGRGDRVRQARLGILGGRLAARFLRRCREAPETAPQFWFTYHLYHKAPDWLGPAISEALRIPYVVAEASDSPKQKLGPWAEGYRAAATAITHADAVIGLNPADRGCVLPLLREGRRWVAIKPFIDTAAYSARSLANLGAPRLIVVAMMRYGDKLASYQILGKALSGLLDLAWSLEVIGDGPARAQVREALCPLGERVTWAGALAPTAIGARLAAADLYVWPAVNEAYGMALLEAQASGLPVVAGNVGGVSEVVLPGVTGLLVPSGDASAFADAVRSLLVDRSCRTAFATAAQRRVRAEHDLSAASRCLGAVIDMVCRARNGCSRVEGHP